MSIIPDYAHFEKKVFRATFHKNSTMKFSLLKMQNVVYNGPFLRRRYSVPRGVSQ